jgi:hypothetical protein
MTQSIIYKLTVYRPEVVADEPGQTGFEYDLSITLPDFLPSVGGRHPKSLASESFTAEAIPVTGAFSFPNPAAPVISPITGILFLYSSPAIGFPLELAVRSTEAPLPVELQMVFTNSPATAVGGAVTFGSGWPGPFQDVTCSFLGKAG